VTLQQLKYAIEIAKRGSMNAAAKSLYISQPSLSNAIRELENELNFDIFIRTNKGISVSPKGKEFLGYAAQIVEQEKMLEQQYLGTSSSEKKTFGISTQHYTFAVNAFSQLVQELNPEEFDFIFRETTVSEVINDVKCYKSEIGILYMNPFNKPTIQRHLREANLVFTELFSVSSYILVGKNHPLASKKEIQFRDLRPYIFLSFGKGEFNSRYFSEETLDILDHRKNIRVSDRSTLFYLIHTLNGFTTCTKMIDKDLQGEDIVAIPFKTDEEITVGMVFLKNHTLSQTANLFIRIVRENLDSLL
jgi:DNA-binding transcriptional LysR family regulator